MSIVLQVAPGKALLVIGREEVGGRTLDYAAGVEGILFDDFENIDPEGGTVLCDNEWAHNPLTGQQVLMQKFPATGGFIPLGHKRPDGTDHPHAGTGFLVLYKQGVPENVLSGEVDGYAGTWAHASDILRQLEVHQIAYDGERLTLTHSQTFGFKEWLPGHTIFNRGLGAAITDGDDLILAMQGGGDDLEEQQLTKDIGSGCMRLKRGKNGCWQPASLHPITDPINSFEASIVRDGDGSLLATARQTGRDIPEKFTLFLWRSTDAGQTWELVLECARKRAESPVVIAKANDGTVFFAGNLLTATFAGRGSMGYWREISALWPLQADRRNIGVLMLHRCASFEWGPPKSDRGWNVDHLIGNQVQLADGNWHTLLSYRGMDRAETAHGASPTAHTGHYIDEIISCGPCTAMPWNFPLR